MADVPFFSPDEGYAVAWLMRGTQVLETGPPIPRPADGWVLAYTGDMNGDGMDDLLWYNATTARIAVWLMMGTSVSGIGPSSRGRPATDGSSPPSTTSTSTARGTSSGSTP